MDEESPFLYDLAKELMPIKKLTQSGVAMGGLCDLLHLLGMPMMQFSMKDDGTGSGNSIIKMKLFALNRRPLPKNLQLLFDCYENDDKSILVTKLRKE